MTTWTASPQKTSEDQAVGTVGPGPAPVGADHLDDGLYVHGVKTALRSELIDLMPHQEPVPVPENIGLDGAAVLGIGLPEGRRTHIIVMGVEQHRTRLGS